MALYVFGVLVVSNYIARAKMESALKVGYFIVVIILTVIFGLYVLT